MSSTIITLTTDFGEGSPYVAAMKGVIYGINPDVTVVDITHSIPAQDVVHGAEILRDYTPLFPAGTIHAVVVDPGVGTARSIIYAQVGNQHYILPDNGLLGLLVETCPITQCITVENDRYWRLPVSATFHGRDIIAPTAAHISLGVEPQTLGTSREKLVFLENSQPEVTHRMIRGRVVSIDSFGNLITNIHSSLFTGRATDESLCVVCGLYETWGLHCTYGDVPDGLLVALIGSNGYMEIAITGGNAAARLGVGVGNMVTAAWEI